MKKLNTKIAKLNYLLIILTALLFMALSFTASASDGTELSVMIIDTGYSPNNPFLSRIIDTGNDEAIPLNVHGSHISSIVIHGKLSSFNVYAKVSSDEICKSVKIYHCNYFSGKNLDSAVEFKNDYLLKYSKMDYAETSKNCFKRALELKVDFVNYSSVGPARLDEEKAIIKEMVDSGAKVVVASGNEGFDLTKSKNCEITRAKANKKNKEKDYRLYMAAYPACYDIPNLIVVGSKTNPKEYNRGIPNMVYEDSGPILGALNDSKFGELTGTSQAAAIHTHKLIQQECKKRGLK